MTATTATGPCDRRREPRGWKRRATFASLGAPLVLVFALAACGGDDGDVTGPTTVTIKPNSYATIPAVAGSTTTVEGASGGTAGEDGRVPGTQQYTIRSGDFLSSISRKLGIEDFNDICEVNRWDDCETHNLFAGDIITIPPGALDVASIDDEEPEEEDDTTSDGDQDATETTDEESSTGGGAGDGEQCPDGSDQATYEIQAGDYQGKVATNLDLTVPQLAAANANNPAWNSFIVGTEIWLPCDED